MFYCKTILLSLSMETITTASKIAAAGSATAQQTTAEAAEEATTPAE